MISKRLWRIIDNDGLRQVPAQDREIFDVVPVDAHAVFPKEAVLDPLPLRVQQVQQLVGVHSFRRGKQYDLEHLRHFFHEFLEKRASAHVDRVRAVLE